MKHTNNAPERITFASGWYIEYPKGFQKGDPRDGEYWLYDNKNIGKMIVGFDEDSTLEFAAAMQPQVSESDEAVAREIIKLHRPFTDYAAPSYVEADMDVEAIADRIDQALQSERAKVDILLDALRIQSMMEDFCREKAPTATDGELRAILYNITGMARQTLATYKQNQED